MSNLNVNASEFVPKRLKIVRRNGSVIGGEEEVKKEAPNTAEIVEKEVGFLEKKFGERCSRQKEDENEVVLKIQMLMDEDYPFEVQENSLFFTVTFSKTNFPAEPCVFHIVNEEVPLRLRRNIDLAIKTRIDKLYKGNTGMASNIFRWIRNNCENIMVDKFITEQHTSGIVITSNRSAPAARSAAPAAEIVEDPSLMDISGFTQVKKGQVVVVKAPAPAAAPSAPKAEEAVEEPVEEDEEEEGEEKKVEMAKFAESTAHKGTQCIAHSMQLTNVGTAICTKMTLVVACGRCNAQTLAVLEPNVPDEIECGKCHAVLNLNFRVQMLHEASAIVGYIDNKVCGILEVLSSQFELSCLECSETNVLGNLLFACKHELNCMGCHKKMEFYIGGISFKKIKEEHEVDPKFVTRPKKAKDPREMGIHVGRPLPDNGTCKHYRQSKRWLRFPCCGRAWPCDKCHDENSDHTCEFGNRMLCGYCSKEQPFAANKPCINCGKYMTSVSKTHWEGGEGCRDQTKMSRRDSHKYSNSALKTKSARSMKKKQQ